MHGMQWQSEFESGIEAIDHEHRQLVALVNEICAQSDAGAPPDVVARGLGELLARASEHFALEESILRERKASHYDLHKKEHEQLLEEIRTMMDAYEDGRCETCGMTLDECLSDWCGRHFRRSLSDDGDAAVRG